MQYGQEASCQTSLISSRHGVVQMSFVEHGSVWILFVASVDLIPFADMDLSRCQTCLNCDTWPVCAM